MSRDNEGSHIKLPWDEEASSSAIRCPKCRNDGMDGTITGRSTQFGLTRICKKCGHKWQGGVGVQKADFSSPLPIEGVDSGEDDVPSVQYTGAEFRDPNKNYE